MSAPAFVGVAVVLGLTACGGKSAAPLSDAGGQGMDGGVLLVDSAALDFGNVVVNSSATQKLVLSNHSSFDLTVLPELSMQAMDQPFSADATGPFTVTAGGTFDVAVTFAPLAASSSDTATLTFTPQGGTAVSVGLAGVALQTGLQISPAMLDFNFVQPGQLRTLPLQLSNAGNKSIHISSIAVATSASAFSVDAGPLPLAALAPGASVTAEVTFAPGSSLQQHSGELQIASDDVVAQQSIDLAGYGGGANISCMPSGLDFGELPAGLKSTLLVTCTNTGTDVPVGASLDPTAELAITGFTFSQGSGAYTAAIDPQSPQGALLAGQSVQIDVTYAPTTTQSDTVTLTVESNVTTPPAPPILSVTAAGVVEGKCFYQLSPNPMNWGEVPGATSYTLPLTIENLGPNECLVNRLDLLAGTDNAFNLTPVLSQRLSPPGALGGFPTTLTVPVAFSPGGPGPGTLLYSGSLGFTISDPDMPDVEVPLSAFVGSSCFQVQPALLDFGAVGNNNGAFCSATRETAAINRCQQAVTLDSVTATAGTGVFGLAPMTLPMTLQPGQNSGPFTVTFTPPDAGTFFGSAAVQTDLQQVPFGLSFQGTAVSSGTFTDVFQWIPSPVDILWVMDTADSAERQTVAAQAATFLMALGNLSIDFHMAVTSTDVCDGGAAEDGRIVGCPGCHIDSTPTVVTGSDFYSAQALQTLMALGGAQDDDCGTADDEQLFEATYEAIVSEQGGATYNGVNGFLRPNAALAIVVVNGDNNDDASEQTADWYANQFLTVKDANRPGLFSWSYINPSGLGVQGGLQSYGELPQNIATMLGLVGGVALDTTQSNWEQGLEYLWGILARADQARPLSGTPDPASIKVYLDGPPPDQIQPGQSGGVQILSTNSNGSINWTYDVTSNSITVNQQNVSLGDNSSFYVEYTLACP
jgi:hypothetical protein